MGLLFSRFRKKKTTIEILDELDKKIKDIEEYGQSTEQRHKKIVGSLIIYSVALYIIAAVVFYFYFFPAKLYDQVFYITPLLLFPILILFLKKGVSWYYKRKISQNHDKLSVMQQEKKKILDEVTETETYKKAKEILMKYAPDQLRMTPLTPQSKQTATPVETPIKSTPQAVVPPIQGGTELRRRALASNIGSNVSVSRGGLPVPFVSGQPTTPTTPYRNTGRNVNSVTPAPRTPLPRPILPQHRSYVDKLVEYVVGDGPSNRYALICRQCDSHNGMSLKEEFEYFAFRCCYCNFWNPARKQKPSAPKLELDASPITPRKILLDSGSVSKMLEANVQSSDNTNRSDTDSDIEVVDKPESTDSQDNEFDEKESENQENLVNANKQIDPVDEVENKSSKTVENEKMDVDESLNK